MSKNEKASEAISYIQDAVNVRAEINELQRQYSGLTEIASLAAGVSHHDLKKSVDALYYLGGGYPTPHSKGKMEAALDAVAGMYRVLDFIGKGDLVVNHLAQFGITISLSEDRKIHNHELTDNERHYLDKEYSSKYFGLDELTDVKSLIVAIVEECTVLQSEICDKADTIKHILRPNAKGILGIEDEEYSRLEDFVKLAAKDDDKSMEKIVSKKALINSSIQSFNAGMIAIPKQ